MLGILASIFVFGIGLCAGAGQQQGWLQLVGTPLAILGGTAAFMGLIGAVLGFFGLFGRNRARGTALVGMALGIAAVALFVAIVNATQK